MDSRIIPLLRTWKHLNSERKTHRNLAPADLPTELVIQIFELAALTHRPSAHALAHVATWTRRLVLPYILSVLVVKDDWREKRVDWDRADPYGVFSLSTVDGIAYRTPLRVYRTPLTLWGLEPPQDALYHYKAGLRHPIKAHSLWADLFVDSSNAPAVNALVQNAAPSVRRVALRLGQGTRRHRLEDLTGIQELYLFTYSYESVWKLFLLEFLCGKGFSTGKRPLAAFAALTHLRVSDIGDSEDGRTMWQAQVVQRSERHLSALAMLPRLTHFAFTYFLRTQAPEEDEAVLGECVKLVLSSLPRMKVVLLLVRDDGGRARNDAGVARLRETVADERVWTMGIAAHVREDWEEWEVLAREDRNIWDKARELREREDRSHKER